MLASNTDKVRRRWRRQMAAPGGGPMAAGRRPRWPGLCPERRAVLCRCCSRLLSAAACLPLQRRPPGDREYCTNSMGRSPKQTRWMFDDDTV
jgi:hypothetical protein